MGGGDGTGSKDGDNATNKPNTESTFSHYAWEIALTLPLFVRGRKAAVLSAALNGLHDVNTRDGVVGGAEDFTVGATRGFLMQRTMERLGAAEWKGSLAAPSKGAALGALNRALGGLNLQNYRDQSTGAITSESAVDGLTNYAGQFNFLNSQTREAWALDIASYSAVATLSYGLNKANKGALERNPLAANLFAAGTIGLMNGAGGEIISEGQQGKGIDWTKVALSGGTEMAVQLAAGKAGYHLDQLAGREGSIMLPKAPGKEGAIAQPELLADDVGPPRMPIALEHEVPAAPHMLLDTPVQTTHEGLTTVAKSGENSITCQYESGDGGKRISTISVDSVEGGKTLFRCTEQGWEVSRAGGDFKPDKVSVDFDEGKGIVTCKYDEPGMRTAQEVFRPDGSIERTLRNGATFIVQGTRLISSVDANGRFTSFHWTNADGKNVLTGIDTPDYSEKQVKPGLWRRLDVRTGAITEELSERTASNGTGGVEESYPPGNKISYRIHGLDGLTKTEFSEGYSLSQDASGKTIEFENIRGITKVSWDTANPPRVNEIKYDDGSYAKRLGERSWEIAAETQDGTSVSVKNGIEMTVDPDGTIRTIYEAAGKSGKELVETLEHFDLTREERYADQSVKTFGTLKNVTTRLDGSQLVEYPVPGSSYERNANHEIVRTWQSDGRQVEFRYENGRATQATVYDTSAMPIETYTGDIRINEDGSYTGKDENGTWTTHTVDGVSITDSRTNALKVGDIVDETNSEDTGLLKAVRRGKMRGPDGTEVEVVIRPFDPTSRNNLLKVRQAQIYSDVTRTLELGGGEPMCIVRELKAPDGSTQTVFIQEDAGESWGSYLRNEASKYNQKPPVLNDGPDFVEAANRDPKLFKEAGEMLYEPVLFGNHDITELSNSARKVQQDGTISSKMIDNKEDFTTAKTPSFSDRAGYPGQVEFFELFAGKRLSEVSPALQARAERVVDLLHQESTKTQLLKDGLSQAEINALVLRAESLATNGFPPVVSLTKGINPEYGLAIKDSSKARQDTEKKFNSLKYQDVQANNNGVKSTG